MPFRGSPRAGQEEPAYAFQKAQRNVGRSFRACHHRSRVNEFGVEDVKRSRAGRKPGGVSGRLRFCRRLWSGRLARTVRP